MKFFISNRHFSYPVKGAACLNATRNKFFAFTLAEVLIVLGIIGVVAQATIPTLVKDIETAFYRSAYKKTYSEIYSAYYLAKSEETPMDLSPEPAVFWSTLKETVMGILSHLQVVKSCSLWTWYYTDIPVTCQESESWQGLTSGVANRYQTLAGGELNSYNYGNVAALLKDGSIVYFGGLWDGPWIAVDVNGMKAPNKLGKDFYVISYNDSWMKPSGAPGTPGWNGGWGASGCAANIGYINSNTLAEASGSGCAYKYIYDK